MKHVIIGDLHGRDVWQQVNFSKYEKAVFLGDYVDSFKRSDRVILDNLKAVIALKKRYPEKIVLLWGTHEFPYLHYPKYRCPGFRDSMQPELTHLFNSNRELFQMAYQRRNIIFTHAGITNTWYRRFRDSVAVYKVRTYKSSLADLLNAVELSGYEDILYTPTHSEQAKTMTAAPFGQITWKPSRTHSTATTSLSATARKMSPDNYAGAANPSLI